MGHKGPVLKSKEHLRSGDYLRSINGEYAVIMQEDGNFVAYKGEPYKGQPLWASDTVCGPGDRFAVMQADANLVLYNGTPHNCGSPYWASQTDREADEYFLAMQDDGNLVIYRGKPDGGEPYKCEAIWDRFINQLSSDSKARQRGSGGSVLKAGCYLTMSDYLRSENGVYTAVMQEDGNFVVYEHSRKPLWASGTVLTTGYRFAVMQFDGNLVLYHGTPVCQGPPYWASHTDQADGAYFLAMQNDGNLVIYRGEPTRGEPHTQEAIWVRPLSHDQTASTKRIGNYIVGRFLGRGAFGETYEALNMVKNERAALKVFINAHHALDHLRREIIPLTHLKPDDHVIRYENYGIYRDEQGQDVFYLAMEFADQGTLEKKLEDNISIDEAMSYCIDILSGLGSCHQQGVFHRDLKPDNIFFKGATLKIGDFGLAVISKMTMEQEGRVGTAAYMAPEQFTHHKTSRRTDLWSVGVILYEMVYKRLPFTLHHEITDSAVKAHVPAVAGFPGLDRIIQKALMKNEWQRYQSAEEFIKALQGMVPL